jgi:hypothetical protein
MLAISILGSHWIVGGGIGIGRSGNGIERKKNKNKQIYSGM